MNAMNRARCLGAMVVICSSLAAACAAPSIEGQDETTVEAYDGTTIFRGVFFGQGPAAEAANRGRPEAEVTMEREAVARQLASLARHYRGAKLGASSQAASHAAGVMHSGGVDVHEASPAERARLVQIVIRRIHTSDPTFFRRFGVAMRTGDAQFVQRALKEASARIFAVSVGPDEVAADDDALDSLKVDVEKENPPLAVKAKKAKKKKVKKSKKKVKRKKAKKQKKKSGSSSGGSNADKDKDKAEKDKEDSLEKDTDELDDEFTDELDETEADESDLDDESEGEEEELGEEDEDPEDPTDDEDGFASDEDGETVDELDDPSEEDDPDSTEEEFDEGEDESASSDEGGGEDEGSDEGGGDESAGADEGGGDEGGGDVQAFRARTPAAGAMPTSSRASVVLGRARGGSTAAFYAWRFPGATSGLRYAKKLSIVFAPK